MIRRSSRISSRRADPTAHHEFMNLGDCPMVSGFRHARLATGFLWAKGEMETTQIPKRWRQILDDFFDVRPEWAKIRMIRTDCPVLVQRVLFADDFTPSGFSCLVFRPRFVQRERLTCPVALCPARVAGEVDYFLPKNGVDESRPLCLCLIEPRQSQGSGDDQDLKKVIGIVLRITALAYHSRCEVHRNAHEVWVVHPIIVCKQCALSGGLPEGRVGEGGNRDQATK